VVQELNKPQPQLDHLLDLEYLHQVELAVLQEHNKPQLEQEHLLDLEVDQDQAVLQEIINLNRNIYWNWIIYRKWIRIRIRQ